VSEELAASFGQLLARIPPARLAGLDGIYRFCMTDGGSWTLRIASGALSFGEGGEARPDATLSASSEDFRRLLDRELRPLSAMMTGRLRIEGDLGAAMRLQQLFSGS
jgi:putative sterol carrier protein